MRGIGEQAAQFFTSAEQREIAEAAASKRGRYDKRIVIIDKGWDRIKMKGGNIWTA